MAQCYFPDGSPEGNLVACNGTAEVSACCAPGDTCVSNGLCKNSGDGSDNIFWRDGCTDKNWGEGCPRYCIDESVEDNASSSNYQVFSCNDEGTSYCCNTDGKNCCSNAKLRFSAPAATLYAPVSATSTSSSSVSSTSATSQYQATEKVQSYPNQHDSTLSTGAKAGIGVAVGILVVIAIAAALWFFRRRSARKQAQNSAREYDYADLKQQPPRYEAAVGELDGHNPGELDSSTVQEMHGSAVPAPPAEMMGDFAYGKRVQ